MLRRVYGGGNRLKPRIRAASCYIFPMLPVLQVLPRKLLTPVHLTGFCQLRSDPFHPGPFRTGPVYTGSFYPSPVYLESPYARRCPTTPDVR